MTTYVSHRHTHWPELNAWLVALGVVLLVAAVGAAGVLVGRSTKTSAPPVEGLASAKALGVVDGSLAALNRGDWRAFGAYWAKNAVLEEPTSTMYAKGRQQIVALNQGIASMGTRMYRSGPCIQDANMVACAVKGGFGAARTDTGLTRWIDVYEFGNNYEITHLWTGFTAGQAPASNG